MWMLIPGILLGVAILCLIVAAWRDSEGFIVLALIVGCFFLIFGIASPINYYESRNTAWKAEQYYENLITPNIIEEQDTYVVVSNIEAGVWQAGDSNVFDYNSYLRTTRHWQNVPIIGTIIYPVPEHLKYVRLAR